MNRRLFGSVLAVVLAAMSVAMAGCRSRNVVLTHETRVERNAMHDFDLPPNVFVLKGAVNTGLLVHGNRALLIDCDESVSAVRLGELGVESVDMVLCTQHRRPNVAGAAALVATGSKLVVPEPERALFDEVGHYWNDWRNRWHLYHFQPGPQVLAGSVPVSRTVRGGDTISWGGFEIRVLDTPGATGGGVSYLVRTPETSICFSGDCLYDSGKIWELYSLQRAFGEMTDYHGFLGARKMLLGSLDALAASGAGVLVPSHGNPIQDPGAATALLKERLNALWRNYAAISALNHYMPSLLEDLREDPLRMGPAAKLDRPEWVQRVAFTSYAVVSDTGAAFLIDCGNDSVITTLEEWRRDQRIKSVDGCWVTHYHDDHVDSLHHFATAFRAPIMCIREMAEVVEHPDRYFLPCISPCPAPVARACADGDSWTWHEFQFTAFHFPGQSYYHGGLLVEGHGKRVFFAGDSGAPTGLDDYTAGNRVFLAAGRGSRRCIALWKTLKPHYIINQHQDRAFAFSEEQLDYMDKLVGERESLVAEMVPWSGADFAVDEWWARTYPYEQSVNAGAEIAIDVQFTNHGPLPVEARVEPVLPQGWRWNSERSQCRITVPAHTDGSTDAWLANPDKAARIWIRIPDGAPAGRTTIPFRITWDGRPLGQFRHAVVAVL